MTTLNSDTLVSVLQVQSGLRPTVSLKVRGTLSAVTIQGRRSVTANWVDLVKSNESFRNHSEPVFWVSSYTRNIVGASDTTVSFSLHSDKYVEFRVLCAGTGDVKATLRDGAASNNQNLIKGNGYIPFGDSITAFGGYAQSGATITAVGNIATINLTNHGEVVGNTGIVHLQVDADYNGVWDVTEVVTKDQFKIQLGPVAPKLYPSTPTSVSWVGSRSSGSNSIQGVVQYLARGNLHQIINAGIGSNTTDLMLARLEADVISRSPAWCQVMGGANDIRYNQTMNATIAAFNNLVEIWTRLTNAGITVVACTVLPIGIGDTGFSTSTPLILYLNSLIRAYCREHPNIILADTFAAMVDNTQTDSRAIAAMLVDTVHPNAIACWYIGKVVYDAIAPYLPKNWPLISGQYDHWNATNLSANMLSNPLLLTTGGALGAGVTGTVPQQWTSQCSGTATAVASLVARTVAADGDTLGNNARHVITSGANNDQHILRSTQTLNHFVAGDNVCASLALKVDAATNVDYMNINVQVYTASGGPYFMYWNVGTTGFPNAAAPFSGVARTYDFVIPANTTGVECWITTHFSGAGTCDYSIGRVSIAKNPVV